MHRIEETVSRGMCIGCGACGVASSGAIPITLSPTRLYQADLSSATPDQVRAGSRVCPFSDESPNEDTLGPPVNDPTLTPNDKLGRYSQVYAGRVADDAYTEGSSSGGLTSWLLSELLDASVIDAVLNVGAPGASDRELFSYHVSDSEDVIARRKSQYYAVSMAEVLELAEKSTKRYAIIGIPCYIKAVRALCRERPSLTDKFPYFVSLVCGHLKTQAFGESLAWQLGVSPDVLEEVDFRHKIPGQPADKYHFAARQADDEGWQSAMPRDLVGGNWGHGAFQPEACNFCDDVVGETADISFGDAWLGEYTKDPRGTNVAISRNRALDRLLEGGRDRGVVTLYPITPDEVIASQAGGFRFRREGLALRLADDLAQGLSVPVKRVKPDAKAVPRLRAMLLRQRRRLATLSHQAFQQATSTGDLNAYLVPMQAGIDRYNRIDRLNPQKQLKRVRSFVSRKLASLSRAK